MQVARNLTDPTDGFLRHKRYLVLDRDTGFTAQFKRILKDAGVTGVTTSIQAPNMNAIAERFVLSIKSERLNRLILFGTRHAERAVCEFTRHHKVERPHQGIGTELIAGRSIVGTGDVEVHERLGGILNHHHRAA